MTFTQKTNINSNIGMILQTELIKSLKKYSNNIAIESNAQNISYDELLQKANKITKSLLNLGLAQESIVGIQLQNKTDLICAMIGVINARCCFVFIDGSLPESRLISMYDALNLQHLIVDGGEHSESKQLAKDCQYHNFSTFVDIELNVELDYPESDSEDSLYVYFTSGSTGKPKGIVGKNSALIQFVNWEIGAFEISEGMRFSQFISPYFDAFLRDVFVPLLSGGTICLTPTDQDFFTSENLISWIDKTQINLIHCVPSLFRVFNTDGLNDGHFSSLRYILMSGEKIIPTELKNWYDKFDDRIQLVNLYGTTESTMIRSYYEIVPSDISLTRIPIGLPIADTELLITKRGFKPCSPLVKGDLYIISPFMSKGYLNDEELNKEKFITIDSGTPEERMAFKTGDKARRLTNGKIELIGREDRQIKLNGIRIELDEVEAVLVQADFISNAIVLLTTAKNGTEFLVAFVIKKELTNQSEVTSESILGYAKNHLPQHMVPSEVVILDEYPLLSNGKVDIRQIQATMTIPNEIVLPTNEIESKLVLIWQEVLETTNPISIEDSFNKIGGNSLKMMNLISKINRDFDIKMTLIQLFQKLTIKSQANFIEQNTSQSIEKAIPKADHKSSYQLSSAQKRLYFLNEFDSETLAYNMPNVVTLEGDLDIDKLQNAFDRLVARHETLRTYFEMTEIGPVQKIVDEVGINIEHFQLAPDQQVNSWVKSFIRPFDLTKAPLIRVGLIRESETVHVMVVDFHHIISDGVSQQIVIKDFMALYADQQLPELDIQYKDFSEWQSREEQQELISEQGKFWKEEFATEIELLDLPTDFARPAAQDYAGSAMTFEIGAEETKKLKAIAEGEDATLFMVVMSLYNVLLSKLSNKEDIIVGTPISGRQRSDFKDMIGMFVNTLPIRNYPKGEISFKELLGNVKQKILSCINNQDYPYEELIDDLNIERDISRNALFDTMLAYQNFESANLEIPGLVLKSSEREFLESKFDITIYVFEVEDQLKFGVEYATALFTEATISNFVQYFKKIIETVVDQPKIQLSEIEVLGEVQREQLLKQFNDTAGTFLSTETIVSMFEKQASLHPDKIAINYQQHQLSYATLNRRANQIAQNLIQQYQIQPRDVVGIMVERSENMMVGLLGILKAGAAYLPIDSKYPSARKNFIIEDSKAKVLILDDSIEVAESYSTKAVLLSSLEDEIGTSDTVKVNLTSEDPCYLIYTSGSTGNPKGVFIRHSNVINFFTGMSQKLPFDEESCMLAVTTISFDISVLELFWTLCNGIEVVLHPSDVTFNALDHYTSSDQEPVDFGLFFFSSYNNDDNGKYDLLLDSTKYADQNGFSSVWTPERHFHEFGGLYPNPSVMSAALSMVTNQIELRSGSVVSPLHDPIRIAEEWSVVDNLSDGRVALSFASGWNSNDFVLSSNKYEERHQVMFDQIETIQNLWKGGTVSRTNSFDKEVDLQIFPRPIQEELPIWITAAGNLETFKKAGAIGANVVTHLLGQSLDELQSKIEAYKIARTEAGFNVEDGKVAVMLHTFVGDDLEEVEKIVKEPFIEYLKSSIGLDKVMMEEAGFNADDISEEQQRLILNNAFKRYYKSSSLIGTPASCNSMVKKLKSIGVNEIACLVDFGVAKDLVMASLEKLNDVRASFEKGQELKHKPITMLQTTPSYLRLLEQTGDSNSFLESLKLLLVGGEAFPLALANQLKEKYQSRVFNMYGPTETTIWSTVEEITEQSDKMTIGNPILNTQVYIYDDYMNLVPQGVVGNLFIGGAGVSQGYWDRKELTNERFIDNPLEKKHKIYRTGDLAKWLPDGRLEYVGREDQQLKIRGLRIELGEIESHMSKHELVKEAVVIGKENDGDQVLIGYYSSDKALELNELRSFLKDAIPNFMIPTLFVHLEEFPLTPNGKIDRRSLPSPEFQKEKGFLEPNGEIEEKLVGIWSDVLKLEKDQISTNTGFFELGGHSLRAIVLVNKVSKAFSVNLPLKVLFEHNDILSLSTYIKSASKTEFIKIEKAEVKSHYKISDAQKSMYILNELDKSSLFYNQPRVIKLEGEVDHEKLSSVFQQILNRHEILRTVYEIVDNEPVQKVLDPVDFVLEHYTSSEENLKSFVQEIVKPFDLTKDVLLKAGLVKINEGVYYLFLDTHHIAIDATSDGILINEIAELYSGNHLPEINLQYKDYAEWQQSDARQLLIHEQKSFWINQFSDEMQILELPTDYEEPVPQDQKGGVINISMSEEETQALKALADENDASLYMVILSIYNILLGKIANQEDVMVGTLVSGREHDDIEQMLGMFVAAIPLRNYPEGSNTFEEFLNKVKTNTLACFENQAYLYKSPVHELNIQRKSNTDAPFNAFYVFENFEREETNDLKDIAVPEYHSGEMGESRYQMNLVATEENGKLGLTLACNNQFKKETRERFGAYLKQIIKYVVDDHACQIANINLISFEEQQKILFDFNNTQVDLDEATSFISLFQAQAAKTPDAIAVSYRDQKMTYESLNQATELLAMRLNALQLEPNAKVATYMPRGIEMLISILAIFRSGGTYVPIDTDYPQERVKEILRDSEAGTVLTISSFYVHIENHLTEIPSLKEIVSLDSPEWKNASIKALDAPYRAHDLAYIIYTSGSTGKPKGALIHQLGMLNHLYAKSSELNITANDIIAQTASPCFDISVWQFLVALITGAKTHIIDKEVVLDPPELMRELRTEKVSVFESVPSLMDIMLDTFQENQTYELPDLRWMIPTGEALSLSLTKKWYHHFKDIQLLNAYGPTEASDDVTHHLVPKPNEGQSSISIGKPIQNTHIYILDEHLNLCPVGIKGEICVAGLGVGKGYWNNDEKTKASFISNPFSDQIKEENYSTIYKTGDIGYFQENGDIICMGRIDDQVKIRGFRIEPGEIERVLIKHKSVKNAIVMTHSPASGDKKLVAFVVQNDESYSLKEVKSYLGENLPSYMIPALIMTVEKIPLTMSGKTDKNQLLSKVSVVDLLEENYVKPETALEKQLVEIWKNLLSIEKVGTNDSFFDLGGHSLNSLILINQIHKELNVKVSLKDFFTKPTIKLLAEFIEVNLWLTNESVATQSGEETSDKQKVII